MKLLPCFLLAALASLAQQQPAAAPETKPEDRCTIEGQVLNSATGAPVRKAELFLHGSERRSGAGMPTSYNAVADAGGNFTIKEIEPGAYRLSVHRTGFVNLDYGAHGPMRPGATLSLRPGQRLKDLAVRLTPHAVIAGRIVDENNEPMASVQVQAMLYTYMTGKKQLMPRGSASTNDLGEYRIYGLAPGRYYLHASPDSNFEESAMDRSAVPVTEGPVPTYYPGTMDLSAAVLVEVGPGSQLRGVNITLVKARTFHVRGHVEGRPDVNISFFPRGQESWMAMNGQRMTDRKGNFEIRNVTPGAYTVTANAWMEDKVLSARQDLDVGESDLENLVLTLSSGFELNGQFIVEGNSPPNLNGVHVALRPREQGMMWSASTGGQMHDGTFTLSNVSPEPYSLLVMGLPDGYWIKSVRMGEQEVKQTGIDLTRGPGAPLTVTLAPGAGQIDGVVLNEKQQPTSGASVVLVPEPKLRELSDLYKTVTTDQTGHFTVKNIDPGEYKLFAWEDLEYGAYLDPDFLRPVEAHGQSISIAEGGRENVQISLIPAEAAAKSPNAGK